MATAKMWAMATATRVADDEGIRERGDSGGGGSDDDDNGGGGDGDSERQRQAQTKEKTLQTLHPPVLVYSCTSPQFYLSFYSPSFLLLKYSPVGAITIS